MDKPPPAHLRHLRRTARIHRSASRLIYGGIEFQIAGSPARLKYSAPASRRSGFSLITSPLCRLSHARSPARFPLDSARSRPRIAARGGIRLSRVAPPSGLAASPDAAAATAWAGAAGIHLQSNPYGDFDPNKCGVRSEEWHRGPE